jgi:hypothetical protein
MTSTNEGRTAQWTPTHSDGLAHADCRAPGRAFQRADLSSLRHVAIALAHAKECEAYDLPSPPVLGALLAQMKKKSPLHFDDCGLKHHFSVDR